MGASGFDRRSLALVRLQYRLANRLGRFQRFYGMAVTPIQARSSPTELPRGYEVGFASFDELRRWLADNPDASDLSAGFLDGAEARGDRCLAVTSDGDLASYGWYSRRSPIPLTGELRLSFDQGRWLYMYKGFTLPAHRGRRLYAVGVERAVSVAADDGYRGLVSCVEATNCASLRACDRIGYEIFGSVVAFRPGRGRLEGRWRLARSGKCHSFGLAIAADRVGRTAGER